MGEKGVLTALQWPQVPGIFNDGKAATCEDTSYLWRKGRIFLRRDVYRASSSTCESHHNDKHLLSSTLKDTGNQAGLISINGVRDVSQVLSATVWPDATEFSEFAPVSPRQNSAADN